MRPDQVLTRQLVQLRRQALRKAARIDEHQRRGMCAYQLEKAGVDGRPDGAALLRITRCRTVHHRLAVFGEDRLPQLTHVFDRYNDLEVELLADARVDDADGARPPPTAVGIDDPTPQEAGHLLERALGGAEPDALRRDVPCVGDDPLQPFEAERHVRASLRTGHRVDLVDDDGLDVGQDAPGLRGPQEVERLGCGDEHIGRVLHQLSTFVCRRVARSARYRHVRHRYTFSRRLAGDADERCPQVALDVVDERLQRRHVEHAHAGPLTRTGVQPVERPEECRQGLA